MEATILALFQMTAPNQRSTYAAVADAVDDYIGGSVTQADPAGLHRAMGKLARHHFLDAVMAELQRLLSVQMRRLRWLPKSLDGRPLVAVDASDLVLGTAPELVQAFGGPTPLPGRKRVAHAKLLVAWDVHRRAVLGWHVAPYGCDERQEMLPLLPHLQPQTILLLDRGYPAKDFLNHLHSKGFDVIVRAVGGTRAWAGYRELLSHGTGVREGTCTIHDVAWRVVIRPRRRGRPDRKKSDQRLILLTTLPTKTWPAEALFAAYRRRWAIETFYRELKVTITTVERWHSRSSERIPLEIQAILLWFLMAALLELQRLTQPEAQQKYLHGYELERTRLLRALVKMINKLIKTGTCDMEAILQPLQKRLTKPRPGRSFKRQRATPHGRMRG